MIEAYRKKALELTKKILEEYWSGNIEYMNRYLHPDILWIGSTDQEYVHGAKNMRKRIADNQSEMPPVYLDDQEYEIVHHETYSCLVVGRYRAYTKPESGILLSERQRVSFLWVRDRVPDSKKILIRHIHLSNILKTQGPDENFPLREGRKNYESMLRIAADRLLRTEIGKKESEEITRLFNYSEVTCLRADRNYTEFFTVGDIRVARIRANISDFMTDHPDIFVRISRSIIVNREFVKGMKGRELTLLDGTVIQVPVARCAQLRKELGLPGKNLN